MNFKLIVKRLLRNKLFITIITFTIIAGITEILLLIFWANPYRGVPASKVLELYLHPPDVRSTFDRHWLDENNSFVPFETNHNSFILPADQYDSPDYTIAFLGGSITECSYVVPRLRFPALVGEKLSSHGFLVNTINLGRSGATLHDSLNTFLNHLCRFNPDYVFLMHATNDRGVIIKDPNYETRMGFHVGFGSISKWSLQILSNINSAGFARERVTNFLNWTKINQNGSRRQRIMASGSTLGADSHSFRKRLECFVSVSRIFGSKPVLMTQPLSKATSGLSPKWINTDDQHLLNDIIRQVAIKENIMLIDLVEHLYANEEFLKDQKSFLYDGMHVTDLGSRVYAEKITEELLKVLKKKGEN